MNAFDRSFQYSGGEIPLEGTFEYRGYAIDGGKMDWEAFSSCIVTFKDGINVTIDCKYKWFKGKLDGKIIEGKKICIEKSPETQAITMYITSIQGSNKPGFAAFYEENFQNFVLFPEGCSYEIKNVFPKTNSKIMRVYFIAILLLSISCVIIFAVNQSKYIYSYDDPDYLITYPWGAFVSFLGLVVMFVFINPFGYACIQMVKIGYVVLLIMFLVAMSGVCLAFSSYDFSAANFINSETLIDTRGNYLMEEHIYEIHNTCQFNRYDCSIVFSANYTLRTDKCPDAFAIKCFSFDSDSGTSCSEGLKIFYTVMIFQALFEFFLSVFWFLATCLTMELLTVDRWTSVSMKLEEWNKRGRSKELQMSSQTPLINT